MTVSHGQADAQDEDPLPQLRLRIKALHRGRMEPSVRTLQAKAGNSVKYNTIAKVLRCESLPTWYSLEEVVRALDGDVQEYRRLWLAVRERQEPLRAALEGDGMDGSSGDRPRLELPHGLGTADAAQQDLQDRMQAHEQDEDFLRRQLAAAVERAADLEDELTDVRDRVEHLKHQASVDESLRNTLIAKIATLQCERDQLYEQRDTLREQIRESREAFIDLQEEHVELAVRLGNLNFEWARSEELHKDRALTSLRRERERVQRLEARITEANRAPRAD